MQQNTGITVITGDELLQELQTTDTILLYGGIHSRFSSCLSPFSCFIDKSSPKGVGVNVKITSLNGEFSDFIKKAIARISSHLEAPEIQKDKAIELLRCYNLSLKCWDVLGVSNTEQWFSLLKGYHQWNQYKEARDQGLLLIEDLTPTISEDMEVARVVVQIVFRCFNEDCTDITEKDYKKLLSMLLHIRDLGSAFEQIIREYGSKCTLFMAKAGSFPETLINKFYTNTLAAYNQESMYDDVKKFGLQMCKNICLCVDAPSKVTANILIHVLKRTLLHAMKYWKESVVYLLLSLVRRCANHCRDAPVQLCDIVADSLIKLSNMFQPSDVHYITKLYAETLKMTKIQQTPKDKYASAIREYLIKLGNCLKNVNPGPDDPDRVAHPVLLFSLGPLARLINANHEVLYSTLEDQREISDAINRSSKVFLNISKSILKRYGYEESIPLAVKSAAFLARIATMQNADFKSLLGDELFMPMETLENLVLNDAFFAKIVEYGMTLFKIGKQREAALAMHYSCNLAWKRISGACVSLNDDKKLEDFVSFASKHTAFLLQLLPLVGFTQEDIEETLKPYLKAWSKAKTQFDIVPVPSALTKQWVLITKQTKSASRADLTSLYPKTLSKEIIAILLEQEFLEYETEEKSHPMKAIIKSKIIKNVYSNNIKTFHEQRPECLIKLARNARQSGADGLNDCVAYLTAAIAMMVSKVKDSSGKFQNLLPEAYCLRALCRQEVKPNLKEAIEDVDAALKLWLRQMEFTPDKDIDANYILILLCYVANMLSVKGYMGLHRNIYKIMMKWFKWKGEPWPNCIAMLWRSSSHAFCPSPIGQEFIQTMPASMQDSFKFWTNCIEKAGQEAGFRQSLSVTHTLSYPGSDDYYEATGKVKQTIESVTPESSNSQLFMASHLCYDLAELLIAKGSTIEALVYANRAYEMRRQLFETRFWCKKAPYPYIVGTEEIPSKEFVYHVNPEIATNCWRDNNNCTINFLECMVTPWNVLQVYLESKVQIGSFLGILGEEKIALDTLLLVQDIAKKADLRQFAIKSSFVMAKLYAETGRLRAALTELCEVVVPTENKSSNLFSCSNCTTILIATSRQQFGDIKLRLGKSTESKDYYDKAKKLLEHQAWKNNVSTSECSSTLCGGHRSSSSEVTCWHCLPETIMKDESLQSKVQMKWECLRRRLLLRVLSGLASYWRTQKNYVTEHKLLLQSIWVLTSRTAFCLETPTSCPPELYRNLIQKNVTSEMFASEYAYILYKTCQSSLKKLREHNNFLLIEEIVSGLKLSYILCREVPILCKKVSRLLCVLFAICQEEYPQSYKSFLGPKLSTSTWSSFFHQESVGSWFDNVMSLRKRKQEHCDVVNVSTLPSSTSLRLVSDLENHIKKFFDDLPPVRILCISIYGKDDFKGILHMNYIMMSRLGLKNNPTVILVPIKDVAMKDVLSIEEGSHSFVGLQERTWRCPWGQSTVIDSVAKPYRKILRDRHHGQRDDITNKQLQRFLEIIERDWFDYWKYILIGERLYSNSEPLDKILKEGGCCYLNGKSMNKDGKRISKELSSMGDNDLKSERYPLIYVLDFEIEMLPWENLPVLIKGAQEVYRMPSVRSISHILDMNCDNTSHVSVEEHTIVIPTIDPLDTYYVVNPQGDLTQTDNKFWEWFRKNHIKGRAGTTPPLNVVIEALKKHQLFIYFGHGSGSQFYEPGYIEDLKGSPAALLMGCSSASLDIRQQHNPSCDTLNYIKSGSPFVVGCLWDVSSVDIDRFSQALLTEWKTSNGMSIAWHIKEAKKACRQRYLTAGSIVTYGVPTLLKIIS